METLIIYPDKTLSKARIKEGLKMIPGIERASDRIARSDFEELAVDILIRERKQADKRIILSFEEGKTILQVLK